MVNTRWAKIVAFIASLYDAEAQHVRKHINAEYTAYTDVVARYNTYLNMLCDMIATNYHVTLGIPDHVAQACPDYRLSTPTVISTHGSWWQRLLQPFREPPLDKNKIIASINHEKAVMTERINDIMQIDITHCIPHAQDFVASFQQYIQPEDTPTCAWFDALLRIDTHAIVLPHDVPIYAPHIDIMHQYTSQPRGALQSGYVLHWWHVLVHAEQQINATHQNFLRVYQMVLAHINKYNVTSNLQITNRVAFSAQPRIYPWLQQLCTPLHTRHISPLPSKKPRENRRFGNEQHGNYTISYAYSPTSYTLERGYPSEDTLFFDIHGDDFFVIVCDGVSQACLSHIASQSVTQMMYFSWLCTVNEYIAYTPTELDNAATIIDRFVRPALQAAAHTTTHQVAAVLANPPETISKTILDILRDLNKESGSQSTFSCAFSYNNRIYCIWAGNSAIRLQNESHILLDFTDQRFANDRNRFVSTAFPDALRGTVDVEIVSAFPQSSDQWRVCIHSDAFEDYPDRETSIYTRALARPQGRPLNFDDTLFEKCVDIDDATMVELYYGLSQ